FPGRDTRLLPGRHVDRPQVVVLRDLILHDMVPLLLLPVLDLLRQRVEHRVCDRAPVGRPCEIPDRLRERRQLPRLAAVQRQQPDARLALVAVARRHERDRVTARRELRRVVVLGMARERPTRVRGGVPQPQVLVVRVLSRVGRVHHERDAPPVPRPRDALDLLERERLLEPERRRARAPPLPPPPPPPPCGGRDPQASPPPRRRP